MPNVSNTQKQTEETFGFKWKKRDTYESPSVQAEWKRWLFEKYFDGDESRLSGLLGDSRKKILDAGCGSGTSAYLLFGEHLKENDYLGIDISDAVDVARKRFSEFNAPGTFEKCDLNSIPEAFGQFDLIFSEGVIHHTDSVEAAIRTLTQRLKEGGKFLFYVYSRKAPVREYTDDLIRESIASLSNEDAWEALEPLTKFGKMLGDLNIEVEVEEAIPYLGIDKGRYSLQRLFYYKICKAFYRSDYTLAEMNHINFDWFRPQNCHRHSPTEIQDFCSHAGLFIDRLHVEDSGITVIATKV